MMMPARAVFRIKRSTARDTSNSMEQQLACARYVLAGVRGSGDVGAYLQLLSSVETGGWGDDIDDAFDVACGGDRGIDDGCMLHDGSMLSELSVAASRAIQSASTTSSPPSSSQMCVLPHWPYAPRHLLCVHPSASAPPSPCYWLSLVASVCVTEDDENARVGAHHICCAIDRWHVNALSAESASASASTSTAASLASSSSISAMSHHVAMEIYSNVRVHILAPRRPAPPPTPLFLPLFYQLFPLQSFHTPFNVPNPPRPSEIAAAIQRGFLGFVFVILSCAR